jgi:hypothetical protein
MGFIEETGACQHMRDARITTIYEGTTAIQANDLIGRKVAREGGHAMAALIEEMSATRVQLEAHADEQLQKIGASFGKGIVALREATDWLLVNYERSPQAAAAGAVPFLKLAGTVAGAWLMARSTAIAIERMQGPDAGFYGAKLVTARYYVEHVLPEANSLRDAIVNGAESVLALPEELF